MVGINTTILLRLKYLTIEREIGRIDFIANDAKLLFCIVFISALANNHLDEYNTKNRVRTVRNILLLECVRYGAS